MYTLSTIGHSVKGFRKLWCHPESVIGVISSSQKSCENAWTLAISGKNSYADNELINFKMFSLMSYLTLEVYKNLKFVVVGMLNILVECCECGDWLHVLAAAVLLRISLGKENCILWSSILGHIVCHHKPIPKISKCTCLSIHYEGFSQSFPWLSFLRR